MTNTGDREHFEDYREQTRVKHSILAAYLPAYYNILKGGNKNLVFIDGFAGRGTYTKADSRETFDGSPLLCLKLIADNAAFSDKISTIFIEADDELFKQLKANVEHFYNEHQGIRKPQLRLGSFSDRVNEILNRINDKLAPTFLFVDPCGVSGVKFETIARVMQVDKCEVFMFFNIDGVRRIAGLNELSPVLVELLGTQARAQAMCDELRRSPNAKARERVILLHYRKALTEGIGAKYVIPFRVEHEDQKKASHYLIHATRHPLGFRIMKDVMWARGHSDDQRGALELRQRSRTNFIPLFDMAADETKTNILRALKFGPLQVSVFYKIWTGRPDDFECESSYRKLLLELEAERKIEVLDKDGKNVIGVESRRRPRGKSTLGKDYFVQLKS